MQVPSRPQPLANCSPPTTRLTLPRPNRTRKQQACGNCGGFAENICGRVRCRRLWRLKSESFRELGASMEASEIQEYSERLREGAEKSLTYVSLIIAGLAVLLDIVTVLGHRAHTHSVLEQTRAADQWNEYQARRMRVQMLQTESTLLSLQPSIDEAAARSKIAANKAQVTKWQAELAEDMEKARELETSVDREERQAARYDLGE